MPLFPLDDDDIIVDVLLTLFRWPFRISVLNWSMFARVMSERYCRSMSTSPRRLTMKTAESAMGGGAAVFMFFV
jgi:hypothetical protein